MRPDCGAVVVFAGTVRDHAEGRAGVTALEYEAYEEQVVPRLAAIAAETGRALQVGHIFRFHPVTAAVRAALAAGRLGRLRFATGRFSGFKRPRTDVGVTQTDAIHYFDLFAYLFERAATRVSAVQRDYLGRGLDDMSVTTVEYGDVPALIEAIKKDQDGNFRENANDAITRIDPNRP